MTSAGAQKMIEKWRLKADPAVTDPLRHGLWIKGDEEDILRLVKELGLICGRPRRDAPPFTHFLFLKGLTPNKVKHVRQVLANLSVNGMDSEVKEEAPAAPPAPAEAPPVELPRIGRPERPEGPAAEAPAPPAEPGAEEPPPERPPRTAFMTGSVVTPGLPPAPEAPPPLPAVEEPPAPEPLAAPRSPFATGSFVTPEGSSAAPPPEAPAAPAEPAPAVPAVDAGLVVERVPRADVGQTEGPMGAAVPPEAPSPAGPPAAPPAPEAPAPLPPIEPPPAPPPAVEPPPAPPPAMEAAPPPAAAAAWTLLAPLSPHRTFENLLVGAHNRFAHAASMSVVGNVGGMYNPLLLFGLPGTGKSHLLNAIGERLSTMLGAEAVGLTSGIRLSLLASRAAAKKDPSVLAAPLAKLRVLLVDDIHLLKAGDDNKGLLAKTLASFTQGGKQLVLTSVYPPKALAGLEANVGFQFGGGWSVDLKTPNAQAQRICRQAVLQGLALDLPEPAAEALGERSGNSLYEAVKLARRIKILMANAPGRSPVEILDALALPPEVPAPMDEELGSAQTFKWPPGGPPLGRLGVFSPKGAERLSRFMLSQVHEAFKAAEIAGSFDEGPGMSYDSGQLYGVPFAIADFCAEKGLDAALILGPEAGSGLGQREGEFMHAMEHILQSLELRLGWVPSALVKAPAALMRAALDLKGGA